MGDSAEYYHCGEIIVAFSPNYKDQYFMKCIECDEYFSSLEDFISHHQTIHNMKSETLSGDNESGGELEDHDVEEVLNEDVVFNVDEEFEGKERGVDVKLEFKIEDDSQNSEEDNSQNIDREEDEVKDDIEKQSEGEDDDRKDAESDDDWDPLEEPFVEKKSDTWDLYKEEDNDECSDSGEESEFEDYKFRQFVRDFLKSETNQIAFISAYKKQPQLWNRKQFPKRLRPGKERSQYLEKIANEIKSKRNIDMTNDLVTAVIKRIRQDYRERLKRLKSNEQRGTAVKTKPVPSWYFGKLEFLEPFLDTYSIVKLDSQRTQLKSEQIIKILKIYKKFSHLWDTNLLENVCTNKRTEALEQMSKTVNAELGLKINKNSLKSYLEAIHGHFSREKAFIITKKGNASENISAYYEHMMFLYDHVGPFICSGCGRRLRNPLHSKVHEIKCYGADPLKCAQCGKTYEQVEPYIAHARRHMNDLSEKCKECGKMFMRPADLRIHMRGHNGIKPYFCELCGMSFTMPSSLKEHKRRHDKQYVAFCSICSKGFYTNDKLKIHMYIHSNVRNFACKTCGKAFKTKKTLHAHEFTHEEGRNHPCPLCGKMYKNRIGVHQHLRTHRNNAETTSNPFIES